MKAARPVDSDIGCIGGQLLRGVESSSSVEKEIGRHAVEDWAIRSRAGRQVKRTQLDCVTFMFRWCGTSEFRDLAEVVEGFRTDFAEKLDIVLVVELADLVQASRDRLICVH